MFNRAMSLSSRWPIFFPIRARRIVTGLSASRVQTVPCSGIDDYPKVRSVISIGGHLATVCREVSNRC
jgi:hypothetical protein